MITMITAGIMRKKPKIMFQVMASPKNMAPIITAVSGSIEPNTAVIVEPMFFTEITRLRLVTTVQSKPSKRRSAA